MTKKPSELFSMKEVFEEVVRREKEEEQKQVAELHALAGQIITKELSDSEYWLIKGEMDTAKKALRVIDSLQEEIASLKEENERLKRGWLPIETALKDGSEILAYHPELLGICIAYWDGSGWYTATRGSPDGLGFENVPFSHWMPLPSVPKQLNKQ